MLPTRAFAQAAAAAPPPPKHEATGELAFVGTSGNASTSAFSLSGEDKLVDTERQMLSADVALGYLNEQRLTGDDISSATYGFKKTDTTTSVALVAKFKKG